MRVYDDGTVTFDHHDEVREYVRAFVVGIAGKVQAMLPKPVRWLVSADRLADILGAAFDHFWPKGTVTPEFIDPTPNLRVQP